MSSGPVGWWLVHKTSNPGGLGSIPTVDQQKEEKKSKSEIFGSVPWYESNKNKKNIIKKRKGWNRRFRPAKKKFGRGAQEDMDVAIGVKPLGKKNSHGGGLSV